MENIIEAFVEELSQIKGKRSPTKRVVAFLNGDFMIYRLTPQKRALLKDFFEKNNLTIFYSKDNIPADWLELSIDDEVYIRINKAISKEVDSKSIVSDPKQQNHHHQEYGQNEVEFQSAGTITVEQEKSQIKLFKHQEEAIEKLNNRIIESDKTPFAGLLVLPTGAGKTLTAAYWLCRNFLDQNKKVLWIAHRHELLEQAKNTFHEDLAFNDVFRNKKKIKYRIISSIHDQPVNIIESDDIIISSKDSLNAGFKYLLEKWIKKNHEEIFLVIDEAHHSTAKSYRKLIDNLQRNVNHFRMLGLTATPFRTAESEQGLLAKVFPDGIIAKEDLRTLINRGILAEPFFEEIKTKIDFSNEFTDFQLSRINKFDITSLDEKTINTIAENKERNWIIVNHYIKESERYKQTLVFALNQSNALALNKLFREKGIKSDVVISSVRDAFTGISRSNKENKAKIKLFKDKKIDVLINVNILTEGMDFPSVQSIFLARPTTSSILMTQMVGRGLRGDKTKGGGKKKAFIVSFIDNWQDKIAWAIPEKLLIEENVDFNDKHSETKKQLIRLISINKLEEFAILANDLIDAKTRVELEKLDFIERIPLGFYYFTIINHLDSDEVTEKNCEVLVYNNLQKSYTDFINSLPSLFKTKDKARKGDITDESLNALCLKIENDFFFGCDLYPAYHHQDIKDILHYYTQSEREPVYIDFNERSEFDIQKIATDLMKRNLRRTEEDKYKSSLWESDTIHWKAFFGYDKRYFLNEIDLALRKESNPELYKRNPVIPKDNKELRRLEKMSLEGIRQENPQYWKYLSDRVYDKHRDNDGFYVSATKKFKSKNKYDFQIDHIKSWASGGLTRLDNLQLLTKKENASKGVK